MVLNWEFNLSRVISCFLEISLVLWAFGLANKCGVHQPVGIVLGKSFLYLSYLFPKNEYPLTFPRWSLKRSHTSIASDQWQLHNKSIINHGSLPSSISSSNKKFSNYVGLFLKLSFPFSVFVFLFMQFNLISSFPSCSE